MKNPLRIGENFGLPLELVTSTQAILARKRSGKSYTASVQAEELLAAHQQIAVLDPTGMALFLPATRSLSKIVIVAMSSSGISNALLDAS